MKRILGKTLLVAYVVCDKPLTQSTLNTLFKEITLLFRREGVLTQVIRVEAFISPRQVVSACVHMLVNTSSGRRICELPLNELLCYLAATRQIGEAIERVGLKPGHKEFVAVLIAENEEKGRTAFKKLLNVVKGREKPVKSIKPDLNKLSLIYDVSDLELNSVSSSNPLEAIEKLVLEKIATFTLS